MSTVIIGNQAEVRKFTIQEYYRMAVAGIIRPSERVELLNGRIIQIAPSSPRHQTIVDNLSEIFTEHTKGRYRVRVNGPIQISKFGEPEPDLVLYRRSLENKHHNLWVAPHKLCGQNDYVIRSDCGRTPG